MSESAPSSAWYSLQFDNTRTLLLTNILDHQFLPIMIAQIQLQGAPKQLEQHLKADLGNSRIIPTLAELITDKGIWISILVSTFVFGVQRFVQLTLRPSDFIETEQDALIMQGLADEIASLGRDVVIVFAEYLEIVFSN